jgi:hypothetical protein
MGLLDTANVHTVAIYEAGTSSGQRAGCCQQRLFAESTEALRRHLSRGGDGWGWCAYYVFGVRGYMLVPVTVYHYHTILQQMVPLCCVIVKD